MIITRIEAIKPFLRGWWSQSTQSYTSHFQRQFLKKIYRQTPASADGSKYFRDSTWLVRICETERANEKRPE